MSVPKSEASTTCWRPTTTEAACTRTSIGRLGSAAIRSRAASKRLAARSGNVSTAPPSS